MTSHARKIRAATHGLVKPDPNLPAFIVTGPRSISILAGTVFEGHLFGTDFPVQMPDELVAGAEYGIAVIDRVVRAWRPARIPAGEGAIGGFHFAPGGNAVANARGDSEP